VYDCWGGMDGLFDFNSVIISLATLARETCWFQFSPNFLWPTIRPLASTHGCVIWGDTLKTGGITGNCGGNVILKQTVRLILGSYHKTS